MNNMENKKMFITMLLKLRDSEYLFSDMWFYYHEWYLKLMYNQIKTK